MIDDPLNRTKVLRGEQLPQAKLTEADVRLIMATVEERDRLKARLSRMTNAALAERLGVSRRAVDRVTAGETWGHVA